jgi:hypothetical protein
MPVLPPPLVPGGAMPGGAMHGGAMHGGAMPGGMPGMADAMRGLSLGAGGSTEPPGGTAGSMPPFNGNMPGGLPPFTMPNMNLPPFNPSLSYAPPAGLTLPAGFNPATFNPANLPPISSLMGSTYPGVVPTSGASYPPLGPLPPHFSYSAAPLQSTAGAAGAPQNPPSVIPTATATPTTTVA